ncbi:MAG: sigma-70 family RNA polymerase sigma factor [Marmoricola sp.]
MSEPRIFEELVILHGPRVHAYLARRAPAAADDLSSEVWLVAYEHRSRYDPELGVVVGWLFGIARNVLLAHYRRERGHQHQRLPAWQEESHDDWAQVDARLDAAQTAPELRAALQALSADDREVLLLVAWEQLSPSEAARVLDIPAGTARSRLHRARASFASSLSSSRAERLQPAHLVSHLAPHPRDTPLEDS